MDHKIILIYAGSGFPTMSPGSSDEGSVLPAGEMAHEAAISGWSPCQVLSLSGALSEGSQTWGVHQVCAPHVFPRAASPYFYLFPHPNLLPMFGVSFNKKPPPTSLGPSRPLGLCPLHTPLTLPSALLLAWSLQRVSGLLSCRTRLPSPTIDLHPLSSGACLPG